MKIFLIIIVWVIYLSLWILLYLFKDAPAIFAFSLFILIPVPFLSTGAIIDFYMQKRKKDFVNKFLN